jgi:hypothetical protein
MKRQDRRLWMAIGSGELRLALSTERKLVVKRLVSLPENWTPRPRARLHAKRSEERGRLGLGLRPRKCRSSSKLKEVVNFGKNFFIRPWLPMMLGKNLLSRVGTRCLDDVFGGCWAGICRLGKKNGSRKVWVKIKSFSIFLPSLRIPV